MNLLILKIFEQLAISYLSIEKIWCSLKKFFFLRWSGLQLQIEPWSQLKEIWNVKVKNVNMKDNILLS